MPGFHPIKMAFVYRYKGTETDVTIRVRPHFFRPGWNGWNGTRLNGTRLLVVVRSIPSKLFVSEFPGTCPTDPNGK